MIIGAGQSLNASSNLFQKSIIEMKYVTKYFRGKEETTLESCRCWRSLQVLLVEEIVKRAVI